MQLQVMQEQKLEQMLVLKQTQMEMYMMLTIKLKMMMTKNKKYEVGNPTSSFKWREKWQRL